MPSCDVPVLQEAEPGFPFPVGSVDDAVRLFLQKGAYWRWTCFVLFDDQLTRNCHLDLALCSSVC